MSEKKATRAAYGEMLVELADKNSSSWTPTWPAPR